MKLFWITNLLLFQICWFSAAFAPEYASGVISVLIIIHFILSPTRINDLKVISLAGIGIAIDMVHLLIGTFATADQSFFPLWLALLWIMFCLCLNHSLIWFTRCSFAIQALVGAVGGMLSYLGGIQAGALLTSQPSLYLISSLLLTWALLFPTLIAGRKILMTSAIKRSR